MINEIEYNIENIAKEVLGDDFKFRENQLEIIAKIVHNCIDEKSNHQTHLVQAPTGTGKSIILKEKVKQTCMEKYGVIAPMQLSIVRSKSIDTCMEKYGVKHISQSKEIKERIKQTNLKNMEQNIILKQMILKNV